MSDRRIWVFLTILSLSWGVVTGLSFAVPGFVVQPSVGLLGLLGILVLIATAVVRGGGIR